MLRSILRPICLQSRKRSNLISNLNLNLFFSLCVWKRWCWVELLLLCFRFLVPRDMSVGQFIYILSARLHLSPGKALFVFVNNTLPQTGKPFLLASKTCLFFSFINLSLSLYLCSCSDGLHLRDLQRRRWIRLHVLQQWENLWLILPHHVCTYILPHKLLLFTTSEELVSLCWVPLVLPLVHLQQLYMYFPQNALFCHHCSSS